MYFKPSAYSFAALELHGCKMSLSKLLVTFKCIIYILQAYHYANRNFLTKITPAAVIGFPETPTSVAASADQQIRQFPDSRLEKTIVKSFDISIDKIHSANLCKE